MDRTSHLKDILRRMENIESEITTLIRRLRPVVEHFETAEDGPMERVFGLQHNEEENDLPPARR
jgi:hypothetical protein